jgi:hypothetical protein
MAGYESQLAEVTAIAATLSDPVPLPAYDFDVLLTADTILTAYDFDVFLTADPIRTRRQRVANLGGF